MRRHDLVLALRSFSHRPAFAVTAIVLMALAAGANAAVFSVVRGVLLKPLPYPAADRLVAIAPGSFVSSEDVSFWRDRTRSFGEIGTQSPGWMMALVADGYEPTKVTGAKLSDNVFSLLGVRAALGRTLEPGDSVPGRPAVVVIGAHMFERTFGSNPEVIGRTVQVDGRPHLLVGVLARGFELLEPGTDVWTAMPLDPRDRTYKGTFNQAIGRLKPGVTAAAASSELAALVPAMRNDLGKTADWGAALHVEPLRQTITGPLQPMLLIMLAAVGFVLLLAAVNLGTLVLSRSIERAREMAVRAALGASRLDLVRQLAVEQAVLAAAGAAAGLALARLTLPLLVAAVPPELPRQGEIALDGVVFGTVLAATVMVAMACALVPIVLVARPELQSLLRQARSTESRGRRRVLGALVATQIALAVLLGIGAGLMLRSLWNLQHVDPGFQPHGVLTFRLQTTSKYAALTEGLPYLEQVAARVGALPGVESLGAIQHQPMSGYNWTAQVYRAEAPPEPGKSPPTTFWRFVGWNYFETMRIPLEAGRVFTRFDATGAPKVAIVNAAFARREFGSSRAAIGRHLTICCVRGTEEAEIVGVTGDVRFMGFDTPAKPEIYRPLAQTFMFPMAFVVRTAGDPARLAAAVRAAAYGIDPAVPVAEMQPLDALLSGTLGQSRLLTMLLSVFAAAGLLLAVVGVYGVVAYWVRGREREFGIRLALGAPARRIVSGVLRQGGGLAAAGAAAALPAAFALTRLMRSVVYGVTEHDPLTFAVLPLVVLAAALLAACLPARRAARVDPAAALRGD